MPASRDKLAAFNERVKLFAGFLNATGIGLIGFAVLRPLTDIQGGGLGVSAWWGIVGLALHGAAHYVLGHLRKDTP